MVMFYKAAADAVAVLHLLFIVYVLTGGILVTVHKAWAIPHLPAVAWTAVMQFRGWTCPLTPLENRFRGRGGLETYQEGFVDHYLMPIIYPSALTKKTQFALGAIVIAVNVCVYLWAFFSTRSMR